MSASRPAFIAVDWGTTRLRASLVGADGAVHDRRESDQGVQSVQPGGFPAALEAAIGEWLASADDLPILMAGMVGSRNGWHEAPYAACPCGPDALSRALLRIEGTHDVRIIPGVDCRWPDGSYDVMRGEEVQALGCGVSDGLVCQPGTHSKWVLMAGGHIVSFATFVTGELYAAMCGSFMGRLAEDPEDHAVGVPAGAEAALLEGGLGRLLFQARARVLSGDLPGHAVRPFLSSLIIGQEIVGAEALFGPMSTVCLVAATPQREIYAAAFARRGMSVTLVDPAEASLAGIKRLAAVAA